MENIGNEKTLATAEDVLNDFLADKKMVKNQEILRCRNEHLLSLGLIDPVKSEFEEKILDFYDGNPETKYNPVTDKYHRVTGTCVPIEVTDEQYAEICNIAPPVQNSLNGEASQELIRKDIRTIKNIMLFFVWLWAIGVAIFVIVGIANS